ncbi:MAG TPA: hypothetical protein VFW65_14355 [Pseudonocardiaceae bacterium]|nr:hypothetical protein [Pseudonocardiaceae bacterium]
MNLVAQSVHGTAVATATAIVTAATIVTGAAMRRPSGAASSAVAGEIAKPVTRHAPVCRSDQGDHQDRPDRGHDLG